MNWPLVYLTSVFVLGIAAQWLAWRLRLPAILLLLGLGFAVGLIAGPRNIEDIFEDDLLFPFVSLSVALILFEGGLSLRFRELRETSRAVWQLITIGCAVTWGLATAAALLVFDHPGLAALEGAILSVTGPTVIIPLLRQVRPTRRVGSVARWEGIVVDPIGALLAVLVFTAVAADHPGQAAVDVALALVATAVVSTVLGSLAAVLIIQFLKRHWVPDYLHSPVALAAVLAAFTASNLAQSEAGLATVVLIGIILANQRSVPITHLVHFKENLGILLLSALFILLASRLRLESIVAVGWEGLVFLALLVLVVRPASVYVATIRTGLSWRERTFLACLAPRGVVAAAVSSVFALELQHLTDVEPQIAAGARLLQPLTFLVIIGTVALYGLSAAPLARWLKVAEPDPQGVLFAGAEPFAQEIAAALHAERYTVLLVDTNHENIAAARLKGLPTWHASILSEHVHQQINVGGIGRLLAMTSNDEMNSLAALQFIEHFGRANVFQLHPEGRASASQEPMAPALRGRYLFGPGVTHERLVQMHAGGAKIKKTKLTEEFDFDAYRRRYDHHAVLLFVIDAAGKLRVWTADRDTEPTPGQTLISLIDPAAEQVA